MDLLDISIEEQVGMKNLIGKNEKQRRKNVKRVKHVNKDKFKTVMDAYNNGITGIRELSRTTGISIDTVRKYLKACTT